MKFLLDTNTCIIYLRGKNLALKQKLESTKFKILLFARLSNLSYFTVRSRVQSQSEIWLHSRNF